MAKCFACGKELEAVFAETNESFPPDYKFNPYSGKVMAATYPFKDALHVIFHGGYGAYFDTFSSQADLMLCENCVDEARQALPWLDHFLEALNGDVDGKVQPYWEVKENSM